MPAAAAELGLTVGAAAELAGLEVSEWCALECRWVPEELNVIRSIAGCAGGPLDGSRDPGAVRPLRTAKKLGLARHWGPAGRRSPSLSWKS